MFVVWSLATLGLDYVLVPPQPTDSARAAGPTTIFLDRCLGGCAVTKATDSAISDSSSVIPAGGMLSENPASAAAWSELVSCVRDIYAPYDVQVADVVPDGSYVEIKVAGAPSQLGLSAQVLGIAPLTVDCSRQTNVLGFAFVTNHASVGELCATVAHEAGHIFGLDHVFDCRDPMTYLAACTPRKYFLHVEQPCGEFDGARECRCAATQDSHQVLTNALGEGETPPGPVVAVSYPAADTQLGATSSVIATTSTARTLVRSEAWIGGRRASERVSARGETAFLHDRLRIPGAAFAVTVREWDDLGSVGEDSFVARANEPCATNADCGEPWICAAGQCSYVSGTAALGEACSNDEDCVSQFCASDGVTSACVERCVDDAACPSGFSCLPIEAPTLGACWQASGGGGAGGCCGASSGASAWLSAVVLLGLRRRSRMRHQQGQ